MKQKIVKKKQESGENLNNWVKIITAIGGIINALAIILRILHELFGT